MTFEERIDSYMSISSTLLDQLNELSILKERVRRAEAIAKASLFITPGAPEIVRGPKSRRKLTH